MMTTLAEIKKNDISIFVFTTGEVLMEYKNSFQHSGENNPSAVRQAMKAWKELRKQIPTGQVLWCVPERERLTPFYKKHFPEILILRENLTEVLTKLGYEDVAKRIRHLRRMRHPRSRIKVGRTSIYLNSDMECLETRSSSKEEYEKHEALLDVLSYLH